MPLGWPWSGGGPLRLNVGLGYHPDLPDYRDYCLDDPANIKEDIHSALENIRVGNIKKKKPTKLDLGKYKSYLLAENNQFPDWHDLRWTGSFSPVEDQGQIGSCTAQAVIGLVEYLMREGGYFGLDMSRMFLYKATRNLLGWTGDTGAYIRSTIKAMALFGVPPEHEWPYEKGLLDEEPAAYHYSFAQSYKALSYARLDGYGDGDLLDTVKRSLLDGFPVAFGFPVYDSIDQIGMNGYVIPTPTANDRLIGGHAVLAVGYDDDVIDLTTNRPGALIFRNSWGEAWGEQGYAYLPYAYLDWGLAVDFWTIFNTDWVNLSRFE
jgi:C1A family cysteine protease